MAFANVKCLCIGHIRHQCTLDRAKECWWKQDAATPSIESSTMLHNLFVPCDAGAYSVASSKKLRFFCAGLAASSVALPGIGPSQEWITRTGGPLDLELWGDHGSFLPPLHQFIEIVFTLERQKLHMEGPDLENFYIEVKWITSCTGSCSA